MSLIAVVTTLASREQALAMARALVERRLVACAQIAPIASVYRWQGEVQQEEEFRLLLKTREALYPDVERVILAMHSYELPALHTVRLDHVHAAYGEWLRAATEAQGEDPGAKSEGPDPFSCAV